LYTKCLLFFFQKQAEETKKSQANQTVHKNNVFNVSYSVEQKCH